jgi:hypothetical protein
MRRGHVVTAVIAVAAAAFVVAPAALAASPARIHADFADNGRLDGRYSNEDLERALQDVTGQGYPGGGTAGERATIRNRLGQQRNAGGAVRGGTLPFTGLDLALMTVGGGFLLVVGWGFRRLGRQRA